MRRSKQNVKYYNDRVHRLFDIDSKYKNVEQRYETIRLLLQEKYQPIMQSVSRDTLKEFLKDTIYLDRLLRLYTEGLQVEQKKLLSDEYVAEVINS
jgi:hypothetical protein